MRHRDWDVLLPTASLYAFDPHLSQTKALPNHGSARDHPIDWYLGGHLRSRIVWASGGVQESQTWYSQDCARLNGSPIHWPIDPRTSILSQADGSNSLEDIRGFEIFLRLSEFTRKGWLSKLLSQLPNKVRGNSCCFLPSRRQLGPANLSVGQLSRLFSSSDFVIAIVFSYTQK